MKKTIALVLIICFSLLVRSVFASAISFKIIYEIDPAVEAQISTIENFSSYQKITSFKKQEDSAKEKNENFSSNSDKFFEHQKAFDIKKITLELQEALSNLLKKKFLIKNENTDYVVSYKVEEIAYADTNGKAYVSRASYKLIKGQETIYQNSFSVVKNFKEVRQLAKIISSDLYGRVVSLSREGNGPPKK